MPDVRVGPRAARELRKLEPRVRRRLLVGLEQLAQGKAADVRAIAGHAGWLRLRIGDHRVLYRLVSDETGEAYLVARVVDRRDLERAIASL